MTFTKGNTVGASTRFGDQWEGVRFGAKTLVEQNYIFKDTFWLKFFVKVRG